LKIKHFFERVKLLCKTNYLILLIELKKFHSHSIVPQPRKGLFLFIKLLTPPHFSRQPYRQKLRLLFSLGNFGPRQKSPIALNRQELPLLMRFSLGPPMEQRS